jgi:hypothetical protein
MARLVLVHLLLLTFICSRAQIVNIESKRMQSDTTGWMGSAGASFALIKNVQEVLSINANAHLQYKTNKNLYLLLTNYNLLRGNGKKYTDNMFYHLRFNHKLNNIVRWEVFTQWQQDVISDIGLRILAGTGPRFKLHDSPKFRVYAATAAMYEYEKEKIEPPVFHRDLRSSSYISFTYEPSEHFEVVSTTFYQPLFRQLDDFRIFNQLSFNFKAGKHTTFITSWNYLYDAFPAGISPHINYSISNGISYKF